MRVARLELKDVGPFEDAVFEIPEPKGPGELVLFEGPNGSGKTTILQAVAMAAASASAPSMTRSRAGGMLARAAGARGRAVHPTSQWRLWPSKDEGVLGFPHEDLNRRMRTVSGCATARLAQAADEMEILGSSGEGPHLQVFSQRTASAVASCLAQFVEAALHGRTTPWAAFAFRGRATTATLHTEGPKEISTPALAGALSFGADSPASSILGQFLINLEFDRVQAKLYASEKADAAERERMESTAGSRARSIARLAHALSRVLNRRVDIEFGIGVRTPRILFDGEDIPIDLLGEGFRSTVSWLSDLFVRLERVPWASPEMSPFDQDFWLILDEIEESLHPTMQARILPALRELFPNARIYATTHSPFVVASATEGTIFAIRPGKDHRVRGTVEARPLEPGQSLEWVTTEIFQARTGFVDQQTRDDLEAHDRDVRRFQQKREIDWDAFFERRDRLLRLNEEVWTAVALQEVRVRGDIERELRARREAKPQGAGA